MFWLVKASYQTGGYVYRVEAFPGGPLVEPFAFGLAAIYREEADAREAAAHGSELMGDSFQRPASFYEEPIAWLVTFIILVHSTGDAKYHVEPTNGGVLRWNDDRDVMAIFADRPAAELWAASRGSSDALGVSGASVREAIEIREPSASPSAPGKFP